ncbi:hypothetical protein K1719_021847 [Acacia pycnantha]|nr:hypothetical protein K1719_021847 [Acacia pycnantha]
MSKKIVLSKKPMTVKELFDTGLLDGVSVVYMGGKEQGEAESDEHHSRLPVLGVEQNLEVEGLNRHKAKALTAPCRKKRCTVVPNQDEFQHAMPQDFIVKHQAYFKEIDNFELASGGGFTGTLKKPNCKTKIASGLRGVITDGGILRSCCLCNGRKVIPSSQFEIYACKSYKRAAQYICFENGKSLLELLRACRGTSLHSLETAIQNFVCSTPQEKYFTCKRCKRCFSSSLAEKKLRSALTCGLTAPFMLLIQKWSPRPVPTSKPFIDFEQCNSSQTNKHWKKRTRTTNQRLKKKSVPTKTSVRLKTPLISSNSKCLSSQNKGQSKITKKDQWLHKLVFEEGGLPDGTEVAYYGRGQKLLKGYKKGFGILCRCCNTEVSPS